MRSVSSVCVGAWEGYSLNRTRIFEVPFLTNNEEVVQGEELILEITEKRKEIKQNKRTWREAQKENETVEKRQKLENSKQGNGLEF